MCSRPGASTVIAEMAGSVDVRSDDIRMRELPCRVVWAWGGRNKTARNRRSGAVPESGKSRTTRDTARDPCDPRDRRAISP
jgi:hypothetical protein